MTYSNDNQDECYEPHSTSSEKIPHILGLIQGVHCEGEVPEVLGQWWVQLDRHTNSEVAPQYPLLPSSLYTPACQASQAHREEQGQTVLWDSSRGLLLDILYVHDYRFFKAPRRQMGETQMLS